MCYEYLRCRPARSFPGWSTLTAAGKRHPPRALCCAAWPTGRCDTAAGFCAAGLQGHRRGWWQLNGKSSAATIAADRKLYERQIEATKAEIDALVYELYGLTQEESPIVEGRE